MRAPLRILKISFILIISFSVILFTASFLFQDKVADVLIKSLNNNISTQLDFGSLRLTFLKHFPRASLELKNVLVHASPDFNRSSFPDLDTDTLLAANSVSIEFRISDIIRGKYNIERIGIKAGKLILLSDNEGHVNYEIKTKNPGTGSSEFELNLERINLTDISATYNNLATRLIIQGAIGDGRLKSRISNDNIDFEAVSSMHISLFQLYNTRITRGIDAELDISLNDAGGQTIFRESTLKFNGLEFGLKGTIKDANFLNIEVTGNKIDLSKVRSYLPDSLQIKLAGYDPSGICQVQAGFIGVISRTKNPHIEIKASLENGRIKYGRSGVAIRDLSFSGTFSNGSKNTPQTSNLTVNNILLKLGTSQFSGSFILQNFDNPTASIVVKGLLKPAEIIEFFDLKEISDGAGSIDLDLKLFGGLNFKNKLSANQFLLLKTDGELKFNSFGFRMKDKFSLDNVSGVVNVSDVIAANDVSLNLNDNQIKINGEFRNLPGWLAGRGDQLHASMNVKMERFNPGQLFHEDKPKAETAVRPFSMPRDLVLDVSFNIDQFTYKTFDAEKIKGTLTYKPNALTFSSLSISSLGGAISGSGVVFQNADKSLLAKGIFDLQNIDINNAFRTFNNFGQDFIKAENLGGDLSGSLSLLLPMNAYFKPQTGSLTVEGKYTILKGALIDFEPIKSLSAYIELSELQNISFDKLENDFFIRNNSLYIPQMDVRSTAADLSVNGKHAFDNKYEYHVKILLSQVLSKKYRKNRTFQSDFGIIEDDGLGRISILLKVESKGDEIKVGYDMKAAATEIKKDIKEERASIKTILNEEYGWYKNDTTIGQKPEEKKPKFRIIWDESGETEKTIPETEPVKKTAPVKSIFKKRIN